ncbi:hypothetical protein [Enterobacter pseudoroggenkampii]|uniref:hypothetical protein n=1 Tax=Enterobacter pseudoroggenkampii TaxID=2996112 RepID=UPI002263D1B8|nr:hypothetical protein [Enterobacter pseudoroggenkampii]MCX8289091.1 hypothetical protein [Enterobacter pseudoroggenkampii]
MNLVTIKYVSYVAGMAAAKVGNGEALKKVCAYVAECCDEESTNARIETDGVDFVQARLVLQILTSESRKQRFIFNSNGIVTNMYNARVALVGAQ